MTLRLQHLWAVMSAISVWGAGCTTPPGTFTPIPVGPPGTDPLATETPVEVETSTPPPTEAQVTDPPAASATPGEPTATPPDTDVDGDGHLDDDCQPQDPAIHPGAVETPYDGIDQNCDGEDLTDVDGDGYDGGPGGDDCDDSNNANHPGVSEFADGVDNDCDGQIDEELDSTDDDGDGYAENSGDCDDHDASVHPGALEQAYNGKDDDCEGGDLVDVDGDGVRGVQAGGEDCNDGDPDVGPGATETCDGRDQDCDGQIDEGAGAPVYEDQDADSFGDSGQVTTSCKGPAEGQASTGGDCDDTSAGIFPGATEICNGVDEDCDGQADDGVLTTFWVDADFDGWGNLSQPILACTPSPGLSNVYGDCDDGTAAVNPAADELCNDVDDDCNGSIDDGAVDASAYFVDQDQDGYGAGDVPTTTCGDVPSGSVLAGGDCDDADPDVSPDALELCNGVDDDCDGVVDDGLIQTWYMDADGDGYGDEGGGTVKSCQKVAGYSLVAGDCNDQDSSMSPVGVEIANGKDDDCDGVVDDGVYFSGCPQIKRTVPGAADGTYVIDPDGSGATQPYAVYCNMTLAGGGWQLIAARHNDSGVLFEERVCSDVSSNCSGTIPSAQEVAGAAPNLLVALVDGTAWIQLTGLGVAGTGGLLDFILLNQTLTASGSCTTPQYCAKNKDVGLSVVSTSGYTPPGTVLTYQNVRYGGFWFGTGNSSAYVHVVSFNYEKYCGTPGGLDLTNSQFQWGDVACGEPGALYFKY